MNAPLIVLRDVTRTFPLAGGVFTALRDATLAINRGEFVVIVGPSGSGKSTLLGLISGIDRPTRGEVHVDGIAVHRLAEREISKWRGRAIGIVFQFFQLLPTLTVAENVMLPMDFCDVYAAGKRYGKALDLLDRVGVADQADKFPSTLSGGQQQRAAIARALANEPAVLLADEPTGNLDARTSEAVLELFSDLVQQGQTLVMATHEAGARRFASRTVTIADGRIASDIPAGGGVTT